MIGNQVKGGMYGEYPSLKAEDHLDGDLKPNNDFRSTYTTILEALARTGRRPHRQRPLRALRLLGEIIVPAGLKILEIECMREKE